ncbi:hypothetical protein [Bradyrhizobium sp. AZCC 2289]|uniref:hypothetical protein n=1 Tax=Bradyrhizobium sp. AZCC 2289 TaxID=3117026 RepID=UPI002FF03114
MSRRHPTPPVCWFHAKAGERLPGKEGKDGNLLEVRMIASSIMNASGIFTADKTVKYDPAKSVLKFAIGDKLSLAARQTASSGRRQRSLPRSSANTSRYSAKRREFRPSGAINSTI